MLRGLPSPAVVLGVAMVVMAFPAAAGPHLNGAVDCTLEVGDQVQHWRVELDDAWPLASVDDADVRAEYSAAHVRLLLERGGRSATIGRQSGRLLLVAADGRLLGRGRCAEIARS